ncbi:hypothetical protein FOA52_002944 [Chlamydomonas sp. UWO 241]|nr:hypothetical protein FOA52_002944 [Chlamydomonas sp. UWO 241]
MSDSQDPSLLHGTWRPVAGVPRPASGLASPITQPPHGGATGASHGQRPASRGSGDAASRLFDESGVMYSAALHSQAVEERAIATDVRRLAATVPAQTLRPGSAPLRPRPRAAANADIAHELLSAAHATTAGAGHQPPLTTIYSSKALANADADADAGILEDDGEDELNAPPSPLTRSTFRSPDPTQRGRPMSARGVSVSASGRPLSATSLLGGQYFSYASSSGGGAGAGGGTLPLPPLPPHSPSAATMAVMAAAASPAGGARARPSSAFGLAAQAMRTNLHAVAIAGVQASVATQPVYNDGAAGVLSTGSSVVEYFASKGHSAPKKLFYLNRRPWSHPDEIVSPFDLVVVPYEKVDPEYWTMSVSGVVRVERGDNEGEFMALGEWMRLTSVYTILRKLRFFRYFALCKAFRRWRRVTAHTHFARITGEVSRRLYGAAPAFVRVVARVSGIIGAIAATPLSSFAGASSPDKIWSLERFVEEQDRHRETVVLPGVGARVAEIIQVLMDISAHVEAEKTKMESMSDVQELAAAGFKIGMPLMTSTKTSISALKEHRAELLFAYRSCCNDVERVGGLVRLVDYMVAETYVAMAVQSVQDLLSLLENPERARGTFSTTASFSPEGSGFMFAPSEADVHGAVGRVIASWARVVAELPRPLTCKALLSCHLLYNASSLAIGDTLASTPAYVSPRDACLAHVARSFTDARTYVCGTLEDKRPLEEFRRDWSVDAFEAEGPGLGSLKVALLQQRRWGRLLDQMPYSRPASILLVDSKKMRTELQDSVKSTTEDLRCVLLRVASSTCASVLERASAWVSSLLARPPGLDEYLGALIRFRQMGRDKGALFEAGGSVDEMYDLFKDNGGKIDIKDQAHRQAQITREEMHEMLEKVRSELEACSSWLDEQCEFQRGALACEAEVLDCDAVATLTRMQDAFGDPNAPLPETMRALGELEEDVCEMEERAKRYATYQGLLSVPASDFARLRQVRLEFARRKSAWTTLSAWSGHMDAWVMGPVAGVNMESVQSTTDVVTKTVYRLSKLYRDDPVVQKTKDMVDDFQAYLPLIAEACNPAMQSHHWDTVLALLARPPRNDSGSGGSKPSGNSSSAPSGDSSAFSISDLLEWGALSQLDAIASVSATASKEYSLRKALAKMKGEWDDKVFHCTPYKETGTHVVGHTDDVQQLLDDQLMKVQAMNASPFVKAFKDETLAWERTLFSMQDLLDQWVTVQSTWMYLEPIFSSPDIVKQMPREGERFEVVNTAFRALMEDAVASPACVSMAKDLERLDALREASKLLEQVQRGLAAYLEKKRLYFPRPPAP